MAMFLGQMVSFWYGAKLVEDKELNLYGVISVFQAISMATLTLGTSVSFAPNVAGGRLAAARLFKLIDEPSPIDPFSESGKKQGIEGKVELKDVHFRYPTRMVNDI
jgi:ATP-binding cassette subfamily B (MDR/TAP) protein 1